MSLSHSPKIVTSGLKMYLDAKNKKSYPGSGNIWYDLSGNGYYATKTGDGSVPSFNTSGYFDYSANSPATTSTAWGGNGFYLSADPAPTTGSFSISIIMKRDISIKAAGDRETFLSNTGWADGYRFGSSGYTYVLIGGANAAGYQEQYVGSTNIFDNKWHIVTVVIDRAAQLGAYRIYSYVDGQTDGFVNIYAGAGGNVAFPAPSAPFGPGYGGCCDSYAGIISSVMFYDKALSASEVLQNFNAVRGRYGI